jgi:type IV pilus assembly protein PilM
MFLKKKNPIGLDIGSSYIKAVRLNDTKAGYELSMFEMVSLQPGVIADGAIADKAALASSIKELLRKANIKKDEAVIGISGHSAVIVKKITIPLMTEDELSTSIKYEAEQYVPFDINDVNIDFQILGPNIETEEQMDVVLVAARKDITKDFCDAVNMAGLIPVVADVDSFALCNMYECNYDIPEKGNIALINVGASTTNICIISRGMPVFVRDSIVGSNLHTEVLTGSLNISMEDAERLKMGRSVEGVSQADVHMAIASASEEMFTEIFRSFEYFRSSIGDESIDRIALSGGAALIKGFPEAMSDRLGIGFEVVDPFRKIKIPDKLADKLGIAYIHDMSPIAAVAVGLALRKAGDRI